MLEPAHCRLARSNCIFSQHPLQGHHIADLTSTMMEVFNTSGKTGKGYKLGLLFSLIGHLFRIYQHNPGYVHLSTLIQSYTKMAAMGIYHNNGEFKSYISSTDVWFSFPSVEWFRDWETWEPSDLGLFSSDLLPPSQVRWGGTKTIVLADQSPTSRS